MYEKDFILSPCLLSPPKFFLNVLQPANYNLIPNESKASDFQKYQGKNLLVIYSGINLLILISFLFNNYPSNKNKSN